MHSTREERKNKQANKQSHTLFNCALANGDSHWHLPLIFIKINWIKSESVLYSSCRFTNALWNLLYTNFLYIFSFFENAVMIIHQICIDFWESNIWHGNRVFYLLPPVWEIVFCWSQGTPPPRHRLLNFYVQTTEFLPKLFNKKRKTHPLCSNGLPSQVQANWNFEHITSAGTKCILFGLVFYLG